MDFATIYIKEAHPTDGIVIDGASRVGSGWNMAQPTMMAERVAAAKQFRLALDGREGRPYGRQLSQ